MLHSDGLADRSAHAEKTVPFLLLVVVVSGRREEKANAPLYFGRHCKSRHLGTSAEYYPAYHSAAGATLVVVPIVRNKSS